MVRTGCSTRCLLCRLRGAPAWFRRWWRLQACALGCLRQKRAACKPLYEVKGSGVQVTESVRVGRTGFQLN